MSLWWSPVRTSSTGDRREKSSASVCCSTPRRLGSPRHQSSKRASRCRQLCTQVCQRREQKLPHESACLDPRECRACRLAQHSQRLSGRALLIDGPIAKPRPDGLDHFFYAGIIERANQETERILECRPTEACATPSNPDGPSENNAALIFLRFSQVGQTNFVILDELAQFLRRRFGS